MGPSLDDYQYYKLHRQFGRVDSARGWPGRTFSRAGRRHEWHSRQSLPLPGPADFAQTAIALLSPARLYSAAPKHQSPTRPTGGCSDGRAAWLTGRTRGTHDPRADCRLGRNVSATKADVSGEGIGSKRKDFSYEQRDSRKGSAWSHGVWNFGVWRPGAGRSWHWQLVRRTPLHHEGREVCRRHEAPLPLR
jgi:hypothetical protein